MADEIPHEPSYEERKAKAEQRGRIDLPASNLSEIEQFLTALLAVLVYKLGGAIYITPEDRDGTYHLGMGFTEEKGIKLYSLNAKDGDFNE